MEDIMLKNIYSVYDSKSATYSAPFVEINNDTAKRFIQDLFRNAPEHAFSQHSEDYTLHQIGTFNDGTAEIQPQTEKVTDLTSLKGD